ncbi:LOG family protein [Dioscorea alata]|uniref:LOG family protein n=1 Tax=Dioscorea alata TaxID=55571 RepID=A0ACB7UL79_DIOAL|nr:LOG family protein [Dioscorea alata]
MEPVKKRNLSKFKKICVFCYSSARKKNIYQDAIINLGKELITSVIVEEVKPVINMHHRKVEMARLPNVFIGLPGGSGILEELFEVIRLLNVDGYYNSLLSFIDQVLEEGFIKPNTQHIIISASNAKELLENQK